ncbi:MAG: hypothetical protein PHF75_04575 [Gallionella sp.]|nr:hypothetical protein [Gallionella sp.]
MSFGKTTALAVNSECYWRGGRISHTTASTSTTSITSSTNIGMFLQFENGPAV